MLVTLYCPCPTKAAAQKIARQLLQQRLIACANLLPAESHYRWEGKVRSAKEVVLVAKTQRERISDITALLRAQHPYELPAISFMPAVGEERFASWVHAETGTPRRAFKGSRKR